MDRSRAPIDQTPNGDNVLQVGPGCAYSTVQTAITAAAAAYAVDAVRRTVLLSPTTYTDAIVLKTGVDLLGAGKTATVLDVSTQNTGTGIGTLTMNGGTSVRQMTIRNHRAAATLASNCDADTGWTFPDATSGEVASGRLKITCDAAGENDVLARLAFGAAKAAKSWFVKFESSVDLAAGDLEWEMNLAANGTGTSVAIALPAFKAGLEYELQIPRHAEAVGNYLSVSLRVAAGKTPGAVIIYLDDLYYRLESTSWPSSGAFHAVSVPVAPGNGDIYIEDCILDGDDDCFIDNAEEAHTGTMYVRRCEFLTKWDATKFHQYGGAVLIEDVNAKWVWDYTTSRQSQSGFHGDNAAVTMRRVTWDASIEEYQHLYAGTQVHAGCVTGAFVGSEGTAAEVAADLLVIEDCHFNMECRNSCFTGKIYGIFCKDRPFEVRGGSINCRRAGTTISDHIRTESAANVGVCRHIKMLGTQVAPAVVVYSPTSGDPWDMYEIKALALNGASITVTGSGGLAAAEVTAAVGAPELYPYGTSFYATKDSVTNLVTAWGTIWTVEALATLS